MVGLLGTNAALLSHPGLSLADFAMRQHQHQHAQNQTIFLDRAGLASMAARGGFLEPHFQPGGVGSVGIPLAAFPGADPGQQAERAALSSALAATNKRSNTSSSVHPNSPLQDGKHSLQNLLASNEIDPIGTSMSSLSPERKREAQGKAPSSPSLRGSGVKRAKRTE